MSLEWHGMSDDDTRAWCLWTNQSADSVEVETEVNLRSLASATFRISLGNVF